MASNASRLASPRSPYPTRGAAPADAPTGAPRVFAPYSFVPLDRSFYAPEWADLVSHETPFPDGVCGRFWIEVTARTPLFIGAGDPAENRAARRDRVRTEQAPPRRRFEIDGQPAIPGSSLRGLVSNVVEIASFGKMEPRIDDLRFSFRDLQNPRDYTSHFTVIEDGLKPKSLAGWLMVDPHDGSWVLERCSWSVVRQEELEAHHRRRGGSIDLGKRQRAKEKYGQWHGSLDIDFEPGPWTAEGPYAKGRWLSRAAGLGSGSTTGTLVFTGQPANRPRNAAPGRKGPVAKMVEFIFHSESGEPLKVPEAVREAFEWAHRNPVNGQPNDEWAFWRPKLNQHGGRVPVFWLEAETADQQVWADSPIKAMGLAMMFRLACPLTSHKAVRQTGLGKKSAVRDLAELIFGYAVDSSAEGGYGATGDGGLKGRVRIGHARRVTADDWDDEKRVDVCLIGPKPAFYPAYLHQPDRDPAPGPARVRLDFYDDGEKKRPCGAYDTWMNGKATIRGWKRYPVASQVRRSPHLESDRPAVGGAAEDNRKVLTAFIPAGRGSVFQAPVDIHNLKRVELGAVIWALTFGGEPGLRHALGMAQPYGYGAVEIRLLPAGVDPEYAASSVEENESGARHDGEASIRFLEACRDEFAAHMDSKLRELGMIKVAWNQTAQIETLRAMADPAKGDAVAKRGELNYMAAPKDFQTAKNTDYRLVLPAYPPGAGVEPPPLARATASAKPEVGKRTTGPKTKALPVRQVERAYYEGEEVVIIRENADGFDIRYPDEDEIFHVSQYDVKRR
jgi:CRISPR-associated protein (TIGR03986 family)